MRCEIPSSPRVCRLFFAPKRGQKQLHVGRQRAFEAQVLAAQRVLKAQNRRMQGLAREAVHCNGRVIGHGTCRKASLAAINRVADKGVNRDKV